MAHPPADIEGITGFLTDNQIVLVEMYEEEPVSIRLPTTVDLRVVWADAAVAGDTAAGAPTKEVELETGMRMTAPMFVNVGDLIRVDTRDTSYVTRVKA